MPQMVAEVDSGRCSRLSVVTKHCALKQNTWHIGIRRLQRPAALDELLSHTPVRRLSKVLILAPVLFWRWIDAITSLVVALCAGHSCLYCRPRSSGGGWLDFVIETVGDKQPLPSTPVPFERETMEACCKEMVGEIPININVQDRKRRDDQRQQPT